MARGQTVSRYEGDIRAAGQGAVELDDLFLALGRLPRIAADRHDALARYLSGDEGWRDAGTALGGTFAKGVSPGSRLIEREDK